MTESAEPRCWRSECRTGCYYPGVCSERQTEKASTSWDDDPNHPEGVDCDGYPLSSGERCGKREHRRYVYSPGPGAGQ